MTLTPPGPRSAFFEGLLKANRKLELEYEMVSSNSSEGAKRVRSAVADYLQGYADHNHISLETAANSYNQTTLRYMRDIQAFMATGKYPLEIDPHREGLGRTDYDLFLILTILLTPHRCAIMEELARTSTSGKTLVIGVGSGVELGFIQSPGGGEAYDLYINSFAREAFPRWNFHEEWYRPAGPHYEALYAIELLEHLKDPYAFVADCHGSLAPGGRFVTTTASDVPQFDHLYNFISDEEFEKRVSSSGFELESKRLIPHEYPLMNIRARNVSKARNVFYIFRRND